MGGSLSTRIRVFALKGVRAYCVHMTESTNFPEALRAARTARGWTLKQLADAVGLSASYLSDLEHGRRAAPEVGRIRRLAGAMKVDHGPLVDAARRDAREAPLSLDGPGPDGDLRDPVALALSRKWSGLSPKQVRAIARVLEGGK